MPPQIDSSVLKRFSGSAGAQIAGTLKYLGYIDDKKKCLPNFREAVDTYKTDQFAEHLRKVLLNGYPFLADIDLKTATPSMFGEAFRDKSNAKEDVLRKSRTFFIHAASLAGIELGVRLKAGGRSASANGPSRGRGRQKTKVEAPDAADEEQGKSKSGGNGNVSPEQQQAQKPLEYQLIDLMAEPDIDQLVKDSIWSLVQYLSARKARVTKQTE